MHVGVLTNIPDGLLEPSVKKDLEDAKELLVNALRHNNHTISEINITNNSIDSFEEELNQNKPDIIFNLMDRIDEDIHFEPKVLEKLEKLQIPYTGASPEHIHLCDNKINTKEKLVQLKSKTPHFYTFELSKTVLEQNYPFPLIVKPSLNHNSVGIEKSNVVHSFEELKTKVIELQNAFNHTIFAEEFIPGKDYEVTVLGNGMAQTLPVTELKYKNVAHDPYRIFCYESKWNQNSEHWGDYVIPEKIDQNLEKQMKQIAVSVFQQFKLNDIARIDFRVSESEEPYVLEVTINPCLSSIGSTKRAAEAAQISYEQLVNRILKHACERQNIKWN